MRRDKSDNSSYLSQDGVDLAQQIGDQMRLENKLFSKVVTSSLNRAIQTAIAMGYAVDEITDELFIAPELMQRFEEQLFGNNLSYKSRLHEWKQVINSELLERYAKKQVKLYIKYLDDISENQSLLIISHGGLIEFPLFQLFPDCNFDAYGNFSYCEGYRISYENGEFKDLQLLREYRNQALEQRNKLAK